MRWQFDWWAEKSGGSRYTDTVNAVPCLLEKPAELACKWYYIRIRATRKKDNTSFGADERGSKFHCMFVIKQARRRNDSYCLLPVIRGVLIHYGAGGIRDTVSWLCWRRCGS